MKILLVNKYFNMHGGSETYFFGLAELLQNAGHEVIFFSMQDEKNLPCAQSEYLSAMWILTEILAFGIKLRQHFAWYIPLKRRRNSRH